MTHYQFGVPGIAIWGGHIVMGVFFAYVGKQLLDGMVSRNIALTIMILGVLAVVYHTHLALYNMYLKDDGQTEMKLQAEVQQQIQEEKKENYYASRVN